MKSNIDKNHTVIIDYSMLLFQKFIHFLKRNNLAENHPIFSMVQSFRNTFTVNRHSFGKYKRVIASWHPLKFHLSFEEKKILLLLLGMNLYSHNGINIWLICSFFHREPSRAVRALQNFLSPDSRLLHSGMMMTEEIDFSKAKLSVEEFANLFNNKRVFLSPLLLSSIMNQASGNRVKNPNQLQIADSYKNVDSLLSDISLLMKHIFFLSQFYKLDYPYSLNVDENIYEKGELSRAIRKIKKAIIKSKLKIALVDFLKNNNLNNVETVVLLYFIYRVVITKDTIINNLEEFLSHLSFIPSQTKLFLNCFSKDSIFIRECLIQQSDYYPGFSFEEEELDEEESDYNAQNSFENDYMGFAAEYSSISISKDKIYKLVFSDGKDAEGKLQSKVEKSEVGEANAANPNDKKNIGLFEIVVPNVTIHNVILDEGVKRELLGAVDLTRAIDTMKKWGIKPNLSSRSFGSIKILLYGASGTGKTITAQALAGEAGADLFKVDASNLVSSWVGESTKNVKKVFREFYRYSKNSPKRVFLFMNEADQLLTARGTIMQAADKEYNQMQNLLLEELENFDGVFIATTNLVDLFDTAWNRRFNIKIRFDIPKYETRLKLWRVHISESMPLSPDVNFNKLAEFELAGGSIANAVYNAARKAALREDENKMVSQEDFIEAIESEMKSHLGSKSARVGFS